MNQPETQTTWTGNEVVALVFVLASVTLFCLLACLISTPRIQQLDEDVIRSLRSEDDLGHPVGPAWVAVMTRDYTALGGYALLTTLTMLIAIYLGLEGKHRRAWFAVFIVIGGYVVMSGLKEAIARPRPSVVPHLSHVQSPSFPSGHAMMSAIVYMTFSLMLADLSDRRRVRCFLLIAPILISAFVGFSRVYMGVHYPTDVLAGWSGGVSWGLGCWLIARRRAHRVRQNESLT